MLIKGEIILGDLIVGEVPVEIVEGKGGVVKGVLYMDERTYGAFVSPAKAAGKDIYHYIFRIREVRNSVFRGEDVREIENCVVTGSKAPKVFFMGVCKRRQEG